MSRKRSDGPRRPRKAPDLPVYHPGQRINDLQGEREGEILDVAQQFSHPNADPVHNYLVRWEDGHIEALNERALTSGWGLEVDEG